MSPVTHIASAMDVITDELWIMAVIMAPVITSSNGLLMLARKSLTPCRAAKSFIEPLISDRPTKSIPNPARMPPHVLRPAFFEKMMRNMPIPARRVRIAETIAVVPITAILVISYIFLIQCEVNTILKSTQ